jgi:hypothetical protein
MIIIAKNFTIPAKAGTHCRVAGALPIGIGIGVGNRFPTVCIAERWVPASAGMVRKISAAEVPQ